MNAWYYALRIETGSLQHAAAIGMWGLPEQSGQAVGEEQEGGGHQPVEGKHEEEAAGEMGRSEQGR